jgi:hypothetical protein
MTDLQEKAQVIQKFTETYVSLGDDDKLDAVIEIFRGSQASTEKRISPIRRKPADRGERGEYKKGPFYRACEQGMAPITEIVRRVECLRPIPGTNLEDKIKWARGQLRKTPATFHSYGDKDDHWGLRRLKDTEEVTISPK